MKKTLLVAIFLFAGTIAKAQLSAGDIILYGKSLTQAYVADPKEMVSLTDLLLSKGFILVNYEKKLSQPQIGYKEDQFSFENVKDTTRKETIFISSLDHQTAGKYDLGFIVTFGTQDFGEYNNWLKWAQNSPDFTRNSNQNTVFSQAFDANTGEKQRLLFTKLITNAIPGNLRSKRTIIYRLTFSRPLTNY